jgi:hypothetical protein
MKDLENDKPELETVEEASEENTMGSDFFDFYGI